MVDYFLFLKTWARYYETSFKLTLTLSMTFVLFLLPFLLKPYMPLMCVKGDGLFICSERCFEIECTVNDKTFAGSLKVLV